ncbi:MAG TPA: hypothetical protein VMV57_10835 [Terracidiphilus sp.]|nr:hypothetical protein [Terracidiphilus sp.]
MIRRWFRRILIALPALFIALYAGDWAVYRMRGSPASTVQVSQYVTVPLKGRKTEYDYLGDSGQPCSVSLFPQDGREPCWQLRRAASQAP